MAKKSPRILYTSRRTDTRVNKVKVQVLIQRLYSSKSEKDQALECTQRKKRVPLKDISFGHFCAKLTDAHVIERLLNLKADSRGFRLSGP